MSAADARLDGPPTLRDVVLECAGVSVGYGDAVVLRGIDVSVSAGEVLAILGPNGAGKTTFLNAIMGLATVSSGRLRFRDQDLRAIVPERAAELGVAYVPQGRWLFPYSTGAMNVWSGGYARRDHRSVDDDVADFFRSWPIARRISKKRAVVMSGGEQQVIAIGRGLAARPRLLLLDEPSLGLAPTLVTDLFTMIAKIANDLASSGGAVVLVEQNVEAALRVAARVCVLVGGRVAHLGPARQLTPQTIGELYLR